MNQETAKELVKSPRKKIQSKIAEASKKEVSLSLHTSFSETPPAGKAHFLQFVASLLPHDKQQTFVKLLRFPTSTAKLVKEIFDALYKIFNGQNPVFRYDNETINLSDFYERSEFINRAWNTHIGSPSTIMIVDMPIGDDSTELVPYYYFIPISSVWEISMKDNEIEYICFENSKGQKVFICDEFYRKFSDDGSLLSEIPHNIGYCPAKFLINAQTSIHNKFSKENAITDLTAELDWLLFQQVSHKYAELYMPYPIYWGYEQDCDFAINDTYCDSGYLRNEDSYIFDATHQLKKCPKCGDRITGVGSFIDIPITAENVSTPPVGYVSADINAFEKLAENIRKNENSIFSAATGNYLESINNQAVNEKQILSLHESRKNKLEKIKVEFEQSEQWLIGTLYKAMTGGEMDVYINYGTRFYLSTVDESVSNYAAGKEASLDYMLLDELQDEMFILKHKNDKEKVMRYNIIKNIDPLRHITFNQTITLLEKGVISEKTAYLHLNISTLLAEYERDFGSILKIGEKLEFKDKVRMIREGIETKVNDHFLNINL